MASPEFHFNALRCTVKSGGGSKVKAPAYVFTAELSKTPHFYVKSLVFWHDNILLIQQH